MHIPIFPSTSDANGTSKAHPRPSRYPGRHAWAPPRTPVLLVLLAIACAAGLLLAFLNVVLTGTHQAELRSRLAATQSDAVWHCNYAPGAELRARCHADRLTSLRTDKTPNTAEAAKAVSVSVSLSSP